MPSSDYLPVATGAGNNADSQGNFANSAYQTQGFTTGVAIPQQVNKIVRQSSMIAAAVAQTIVDLLGINVQDDGNLTTLIASFKKMLRFSRYLVNVVAFSATPTFDASLSDVQEITLSGNVTSSTLSNASPGQTVKFIIHQDATGGRTFIPPAGVAMDTIDPGANKTSVQTFVVGSGGVVYVETPMSTQ